MKIFFSIYWLQAQQFEGSWRFAGNFGKFTEKCSSIFVKIRPVENEDRSSRVYLAALGLIVLFAAALRLWGVGFGLPNVLCRPDELVHATLAVSVAEGELNPRFFRYPTLYFYIMGAIYRVIFFFIESPAGAAREAFVREHALVLITAGRLLSVLASVCTVPAVYALGRRAGGRLTGLLAAALLAANYLSARDAHFMTVDAAMTLLVVVALVKVLDAMEDGGAKSFVIAGLLAGLAASVKYNAALLAFAVLAAHLVAARREGTSLVRSLAGGRLWLSALVMVAAFVVTSPFTVLDYRAFAADFMNEAHHFSTGYYPGRPPHSTIGFYVWVVALHGLGILPGLLALAGLVRWAKDRDGRGLALIAFAAPFGASMLSGETVFARYALPLVPIACLAGARGIELLAERGGERSAGLLAAALFVLASAQPLYNAVRFDALISREDTRNLAEGWIIDNLEPGGLVQVGGVAGHHWVLDRSRLPGFDVGGIDFTGQDYLVWQSLEYYREQGRRYALTHQYPLAYSTVRPDLWEKLMERATLLRCFDPYEPEPPEDPVFDHEDAFYAPFACFEGFARPGPRICVFELPRRADSP